MIKVFIPRYRTVELEHGKSHTAFEIDVFISGKHHKVEKRYQAFHSLHKQLKKILWTPEFPPKRLRNSNPKVLEQRRQGLENYVQAFLRMNSIPVPLLRFLDIPIVDTEPDYSSDNGWKKKAISHQPLLTFKKEPFTELFSSDDFELPDILVKGVTLGLYS